MTRRRRRPQRPVLRRREEMEMGEVFQDLEFFLDLDLDFLQVLQAHADPAAG